VATHLLLVDYENVPRVDLSVLDDSYRAIVFVGASQNPPRAAKNKDTAHRFRRVDFQKIAGAGKNALDFHIAFQLGRMFETARETICIVVSRDKGFDPLLLHLNSNGLRCRRVESFAEIGAPLVPNSGTNEIPVAVTVIVCGRCNKASTIEHNGGLWCSNCGIFASPPDPQLSPSKRDGYRDQHREARGEVSNHQTCGWCYQSADMGDGIYDDGEWMCGGCISQFAR
jgi:hypothetical protein